MIGNLKILGNDEMRNSKKIHVNFVKLRVFTSNYQTLRKFMFFGRHFTKIRI